MINQIQTNFAVFAAGVGFGIFAFIFAKAAGPAIWNGAKTLVSKVWSLVKGLASKVKFW